MTSKSALGAAPSLAAAAASQLPWQKPKPGSADTAAAVPAAASRPVIGLMRVVRAYVEVHAAAAATGTAARSALPPPPAWIGRVPLQLRVDVTRNGELLDRYDGEDGLWSLVPTAPPPRLRPDGKPNNDAIEAHDRLVDAVQRGQRRVCATEGQAVGEATASDWLLRDDPLSAEDKEALWAALVRRVTAGERVHAKDASPRPPTTDYMRDTATVGKDAEQCTVDAEHESVSRVHARFMVGVQVSTPPDRPAGAAPPSRQDIARDIVAAAAADDAVWGVFLEDLKSSNGTFVAGSAAKEAAAAGQKSLSWSRIGARVPVAVPRGGGSNFVRFGGSSRVATATWEPIVAPLSEPEKKAAAKKGVVAVGPVSSGGASALPADRAPAQGPAADSTDVIEGGSSAFSDAKALGGMSYERLSRRKEQIEGAVVSALAAKKRAEGLPGGPDRDAALAKALHQFRALERDLVAVQVAMDRARNAARPAQGKQQQQQRRGVVEVSEH